MISVNKKLKVLVILVRGAGEIAAGVAHRLAFCHFKVCMTETSSPQAVLGEKWPFQRRSSIRRKKWRE